MITLLFMAATMATPDTIKWTASDESMSLGKYINDYRAKHGKPILRYNDSLNYVASLHVANLNNRYIDTSLSIHSWINPIEGREVLIPKINGDIEGSCLKPFELTGMKQYGFEMVHTHEDKYTYCDAKCAFDYFKSKKWFRDMIIENEYGPWWMFGISVYKYSASVWFASRK